MRALHRDVTYALDQVAIHHRRLADAYEHLAQRQMALAEAQGVGKQPLIRPANETPELNQRMNKAPTLPRQPVGTLWKRCQEIINSNPKGLTSAEIGTLLPRDLSSSISGTLSRHKGERWNKKGARFYPM